MGESNSRGVVTQTLDSPSLYASYFCLANIVSYDHYAVQHTLCGRRYIDWMSYPSVGSIVLKGLHYFIVWNQAWNTNAA